MVLARIWRRDSFSQWEILPNLKDDSVGAINLKTEDFLDLEKLKPRFKNLVC